MAPSDQEMTIKGEELAAICRLLCADGTLNPVVLKLSSWEVAEIDDKALFDDDAEHIGSAFLSSGSSHFLVARVSDLLSQSEAVTAYRFTSSGTGVEEFQGPRWHELNLDDCLMFTFPLAGIVLRPGFVATTFIAGNKSFVDVATGAA